MEAPVFLVEAQSIFFVQFRKCFNCATVEGISLENGNSIIPPAVVHQNGDSLDTVTSDESNQGPINGSKTTNATVIDEDTTTSFTDNSPPSIENEETNDSVVSESTKDSVVSDSNDSNSLEYNKRRLDEDDTNSSAPNSKKIKEDVGDK